MLLEVTQRCYNWFIISNIVFSNLLNAEAAVPLFKKIAIPHLKLLSYIFLAKLLKNIENTFVNTFSVANMLYWVNPELVYVG